jgi:hypothetical protein
VHAYSTLTVPNSILKCSKRRPTLYRTLLFAVRYILFPLFLVEKPLLYFKVSLAVAVSDHLSALLILFFMVALGFRLHCKLRSSLPTGKYHSEEVVAASEAGQVSGF